MPIPRLRLLLDSSSSYSACMIDSSSAAESDDAFDASAAESDDSAYASSDPTNLAARPEVSSALVSASSHQIPSNLVELLSAPAREFFSQSSSIALLSRGLR